MGRRRAKYPQYHGYSKEAHRLACEKFEQSHPDGDFPLWVYSNAKFHFRQDDENTWVIQIYLRIKRPLPEGEKGGIISYEDYEPVVIARVQVDVQGNQAHFMYITPPEDLKALEFEVHEKYQPKPQEKSWGNAFDS